MLRLKYKIDDAEFEEICKRNTSRLVRGAFRATRNQLGSEELANEAFLVLWKKMHTEEIRNPDAYLTTILVHLIGNYLKAKTREVPSISLEVFQDIPDQQGVPEKLEDGFPPELTAAEREILKLRVEQQLSYEEIAQVLGISAVSCRSRFCRAKERYRELIQAEKVGKL